MIKTILEAGLFRFASENFFVPGINDDPLERKTEKRRDPQLWGIHEFCDSPIFEKITGFLKNSML